MSPAVIRVSARTDLARLPSTAAGFAGLGTASAALAARTIISLRMGFSSGGGTAASQVLVPHLQIIATIRGLRRIFRNAEPRHVQRGEEHQGERSRHRQPAHDSVYHGSPEHRD